MLLLRKYEQYEKPCHVNILAQNISKNRFIHHNKLFHITVILNQVTLNLYVDDNLEPLDHMLQGEGRMMKLGKICHQNINSEFLCVSLANYYCHLHDQVSLNIAILCESLSFSNKQQPCD